MAWTPEDEARYQALGAQLGVLGQPKIPDASEGLFGYSAKTAANILPDAITHLSQPIQSLLGVPSDEQSEVPQFFNQQAPQGVGQNIARVAGSLASYLPSIALPEAGAIKGLQALGVGADAAKIGGMAAGFAYPSIPEGGEATATQGAVGAIQGAAQSLGWRGKLLAGALTGGLGYYEGQKDSQQQGLTMGLLNAAGPTLIDPAMHYIFGANANAKAADEMQKPTGPTSSPWTPPGQNFEMGQGTQPQWTGDFLTTKPEQPLVLGGQPIVGQEAAPAQMQLGAGSQLTQPTQQVFPRLSPLTIGGDDPALTQGAPRLANQQLALPAPSEGKVETGLGNGVARLQDQTQPNFLLGDSRGPIQGSPEQPLLLGDKPPSESPVPSPSETPANSRVRVPEGATAPQPTQEGAHVMASAVKQGNRILVGSEPFAPHEQIGLEHGITNGSAESSVPESSRGFLVQNSDGSQGFANRKRAGKIAFKAGQIMDPIDELKSESLRQSPTTADATKPVAGGSYLHWSDDGLPEDVKVNQVTPDGIVHYDHTDLITGEQSQKVATLQEFDELQKHPKMRDKVNITKPQPEQSEAPPNPQQPVEPAAPSAKRPKLQGTKIVKAAIKLPNGDIHEGIYHQDARENAIKSGVSLSNLYPHEDGFITDKGEYADRYQAARISQPKNPGTDITAEQIYRTQQAVNKSESASVSQVRIKGRFGLETANILSKEGDTLHVEVDDPIFGKRRTSVLASDTLPMESSKPTEGTGTVPFSDVESAKLSGKEGIQGVAQVGESEADLRGSASGTPKYRSMWIDRHGNIHGDMKGMNHDEILADKLGITSSANDEKGLYEKAYAKGLIRGVVHDNDHFTLDETKWEDMSPPQRKAATEFAQDHGLKLIIEDSNARSTDIADYRGSIEQGANLKGNRITSVSLAEGLKSLNPEAANLIGNIVARLQKGLGRDVDTVAFSGTRNLKGAAFESSGRVGLNLRWINQMVKSWPDLSLDSQAKIVMRVAAEYGHELTHVAQIYGENSGLAIGGKPLLDAVHELVQGMSVSQREFIASSIQKNKGMVSNSLNKYLAGDQDAVFKHYSALRPGITPEQSSKLAAGELMAEIGSVELAKRMEVTGLPTALRGLIDRFKAVIVNAVNWFRGAGDQSGVASLQSLSDISNKMFDHFSAADTSDLAKAFPKSSEWTLPPEENPFASGKLPPNQVSVASGPYLKGELARLGVRAVVGSAIGGIVGPRVSDNQMTTAEGMILGGVMGVFGPAVAKHLLSKDLAAEIGAAIKGANMNPLKATMTMLGGGKSLRDLGLEGQFGDTQKTAAIAKFVRALEVHMELNFDPKIRGISQQGRGTMGTVLAAVADAQEKVRFMTPGPVMTDAAGEYINGRISKDQFINLLNTDSEKQFANYITTAREGTTTIINAMASGLKDGSFKRQVIATAETHLSKFYEAYTTGKFNMDAFESVKQDLMAAYPNDYDPESADTYLRQHMQDIIVNREMYGNRRSGSGEKIDAGLAFRRLATEQEIEAQQEVVSGLEHNQSGTDYLKEKEKLDWMQAHPITDNWAQWLGEIKDPIQRLQYTFAKVYPSSVSGKIIDLLDGSKSTQGLNFAYEPKELAQVRGLLSNALKDSNTPATQVARLQMQLKELSGYAPLPNIPAMGKLAGKYVSRFVRDEMNTYESPYKWMDQPVIRAISSFNNIIKIADAPLNPITVIRNYIQMPLFALMARTTAGDMGRASNILYRGTEPEMLKLARERGMVGANYVASEIRRGAGNIVSGDFDADIATRYAGATMNKIFEVYQAPDDILRMGSFLAGLRRFGTRMSQEGVTETAADGTQTTRAIGLEEAKLHPDTIEKASQFTERFTPNYDTVSRIVKAGRQLPFVSLYLSYTSEITKILKNLTVDAIGKDTEIGQRIHAITTLAGTAAIPAMMVGAAESNLSPQDKKDWDKVKKLGPDYTRARFRLPLYRDKNNGAFHFLDITNMLPADDYSQMMRAAANQDWKAAASANPILSLENTPLLNIVSSQVSGQDIDTGRTIQGMGRVTSIIKSLVPPIIPPGYEGQRLERAFSTTDTGTTGITNLESGVQYRPSDIIANYLTGMKWGNVTLSTVQRQTIEDTQQKIADQQRILRDTTNTNVNQEAKVNATNHYSHVVTELMKELTTKLQP